MGLGQHSKKVVYVVMYGTALSRVSVVRELTHARQPSVFRVSFDVSSSFIFFFFSWLVNVFAFCHPQIHLFVNSQTRRNDMSA